MKYTLFIIFFCAFIIACKRETIEPLAFKTDTATVFDKKPKKEFEMYEMSEMASLMERIYIENSQLKQRIIEGRDVGYFPEYIVGLHSATMTDETDRDTFFEVNMTNFLKAQALIYKDPRNAKKHFNEAISACIQCHEGKCGGPIPRIKKLYID